MKDINPEKSKKVVEGKPDLEEKDVNKICEEITELVHGREKNELLNTFEIGKRLVHLKSSIPLGQYHHVVKHKIMDIAGRPLSTSWIAKARRYFRLFKDHPKRAEKVGLRKTDIVLKLPEAEALQFLIEGKTKKDKKGKVTGVIFPEDMCVPDLEAFVEKRTKKNDNVTPLQKAVKSLKKIANAAEKFINEDGSLILNGKFSADLAKDLKSAIVKINAFKKRLTEILTKRAEISKEKKAAKDAKGATKKAANTKKAVKRTSGRRGTINA